MARQPRKRLTRSQITPGEVLNFDCRRALDAQHQRARLARSRRRRARPLDLDRLAVRGDLGADDLRPARDQFGRSKALPRECFAHDLAEEVAQRLGEGAGGLVHGAVLCHPSVMADEARSASTVAAKAAARQRRAERGRQFHTRNPPPCSPGTTAIAGRCRGARRRGERPDPYRVWLSEIMLQQTTVKAVAPYYARFLARWPDVRRACGGAARRGAQEPGPGSAITPAPATCMPARAPWSSGTAENFPASEAELRALPGIGDYTAAAIAAIAFDRAGGPVDGNIERVIARLFAVAEPLPRGQAGAAPPCARR